MEQMIEIMHFSVPTFVMDVSDASSLDAAQRPEHGYFKKNHDSSSVKKFAKSVAWQG
jgi:hypothetical protein